ncbi:MAG TPA: ABC transporter ATP-binding protein [Gemmataceae bacterium]|nr:ABC transporter ATP-binding protein [Gemmataceae bacterium]
MLLRTEHLTKDYGRFRALDDLHLQVAAGGVFGLLGPNGSGKTTALRLLLGFLRPTAGHAWIVGHDCWHDGVAARRQVAYLPGELRLYENMTGRQLVRFLSRLRGQQKNGPIDDLARRLDLDLDRPIADFSSGMKRKVALLQVLAPRAPLLILDEPTNALDPKMRDELLAQLHQASRQGQGVLFSSHVLAEVEQVCDRVGILRRGVLVHVQDMKELRKARIIRARFSDRLPDPLPDLPGLELRRQEPTELVLEYSGPLPPLVEWLGRQALVDLRLEPLGLSAIYRRYHGDPD